MRSRAVAASTATLIAAASLSPITAQAAGQNTIYVDNMNSACTDSGTGSYTAPYCTVQAAADAANPGDVVSVAEGTYAAATITRSGTASAPIEFTGNGIWNSAGMYGEAFVSLSVKGASHLRIQNFGFTGGTAAPASVVDGGSDITFRNDNFRNSSAGQPSIHVTGASSGVTVLDSRADGIDVDGGSTGTVLSTNILYGYYTHAVSVDGAADTAITSNTVLSCGPEVSVTGSSTGTSIENNVLVAPISTSSTLCSASDQATSVLVDSGSAATTTEDYNDLGGSGSLYTWAGTSYPTPAALESATGQGAHDINGGATTFLQEYSAAINSANSAAVGEQPTDIYGRPRILDPLVKVTGAGPYGYYDRGATQFQDPFTEVTGSLTSSATKAPVNGEIKLTGTLTDTWSDSFDYRFELSDGRTIDAGTSGTATVSFAAPGTYTAQMYVVPQNGATPPTLSYGFVTITVVAAAPLVAELTVAASNKYDVTAWSSNTTDAWSLASETFDFGDGTEAQTVTNGTLVTHTYAAAGTYTVTETVTDVGGNTGRTSATFTTNAIVAGTLITSPSVATPSGFVPAGSTGLAQVATTSLPNGSGELLAVTTAGALKFSTSNGNATTWSNWQALSPAPGVTTEWVGIAGMPNGTTQFIEITSVGKLLHTIRGANGTWQSTGWGSPAGSTGFVRAAITAMPDGSAQLVAVTTAGVLMHNIRFANGSWQGWHALSQPGVKVVDAAIAGVVDGSSQIVEVTSTGLLEHDVRNANGSWQTSGWGTPTGAPSVSQVSIGGGPVFSGNYWYDTTISVVTKTGGELTDTRNGDGSWSGWWGASDSLGDAGTALDSTYATLPDGYYLAFTVTGG